MDKIYATVPTARPGSRRYFSWSYPNFKVSIIGLEYQPCSPMIYVEFDIVMLGLVSDS